MSALLQSDIIRAVPKNLKIDTLFDSNAVSRTTRSYPASNDMFSTAGVSVVSIPIPAVGWVDFANSYIQGWLAFSSGLELGKSIHSVFRRVLVRASNGQTLMDTDQYHVLTAMLQDATINADESTDALSITTTLTGFSAYRQAISTGVQFSFQPL